MEAPTTTTTTTTTTSSSHVEGFIPPFKSLQKRLSKCGIDLERDFQILELLQKEKERQEGDCGGAKSGVRPPSICCPPSSKPKSAPCAPTSPPTSPVQEAAGPCLSPVASPATSSPPPLPPTAAAPEHREAVVCCICLDGIAEEELFELDCSHQMCRGCLEGYYSLEVSEGRTHVTCPLPDCAREVGAAKVQELLSEELFDKFTRFSLKKALKADPHSHFCPAPDCDYAILIKPRKSKGLLGLGRKRCTKPEDQQHVCGNPACRTSFCLQCGDVWHPALTCEENRSLKATLGGQLVDTDNVKPCPKCSVPIFKLQDGSCNHMKCAMCETEFCWICMKEVNDLHYFSPSGCTFYAEKPWSMKKKMAFRTTIAVTAPAIIGAAAVASVPAVLIGFPVKVGQKLSRRFKHQPLKRALALGAGVPGAILASPLVAAAAIAVGVPALLIGTYVVFPVYLYKEHTKNKKIQLEKKLANSTIMLDLNVDPDLIAE